MHHLLHSQKLTTCYGPHIFKNKNLLMADAIATLVRPVPWDGSFTPLPPYLSQPSQLPKTESVAQFLCERCRAFSTKLEATQRLKFKFEKIWIEDVGLRFLGKYIYSFFSFYETWNKFYESYEK